MYIYLSIYTYIYIYIYIYIYCVTLVSYSVRVGFIHIWGKDTDKTDCSIVT